MHYLHLWHFFCVVSHDIAFLYCLSLLSDQYELSFYVVSTPWSRVGENQLCLCVLQTQHTRGLSCCVKRREQEWKRERERERDRDTERERRERKRVVILCREESKRGVRLRPKKRKEEGERGVSGCVQIREKRESEQEARETVSARTRKRSISTRCGEEESGRC
jgi:hypothetical protein